MAMPVNRGAAVGLGVLGAGVLGAVLLTRSGTSAPAITGLQLSAVAGLGGAPGQVLTATLTLRNPGAALAAQSVTVGVVATQGSLRTTTAATVQVPALAPLATAQVPLTTQGPLGSAFGPGTVQVVFALADGSTISGTFQVSALPAAFDFVAGSLSIASPVQVGQYATATMQVINNGGTAGVPTVAGVTTYSGTTEGNWAQQNAPSIAAGATATINMQTEGTIASQFAGDTLTATFAVS